jgi:acyl-CoA synthetase (AMP-forming)/AMP-acid ligase II
MEGTVLCAANHAPLTPISFLERAALVYPDRPAIVAAEGHGHASAPRPRTWRETRDRCLRLAAALAGLGVARRDVVSLRPLISSPLFSSCSVLRSARFIRPLFTCRRPSIHFYCCYLFLVEKGSVFFSMRVDR